MISLDMLHCVFRKSIFRRVRKNVKSDYYLRHVRPSAWNNSTTDGRILMKFDIYSFLENLSRKIEFHS